MKITIMWNSNKILKDNKYNNLIINNIRFNIEYNYNYFLNRFNKFLKKFGSNSFYWGFKSW